MSFAEIAGFHHPGAVQRMQYSRLGETDMQVSRAALGCASFASTKYIYGEMEEAKAVELVHQSLKSGVNYVDTAYWYGQGNSERVLGKALKGVPRNAYYISTKIGYYEIDPAERMDYGYNKTLRAVEDALERLGLEYLDIVYCHEVEFPWLMGDREVIWNGALRALNDMKKAGKVRYAGISAYGLEPLADVIKRSPYPVDVVLTYAQATLFNNDLQFYLDALRRPDGKRVGIVNASPTGLGLLTPTGPQFWHAASAALKQLCLDYVAMCTSAGLDAAKLAIHYASHFEGVDCVLLGITDVAMLSSSLDAVLDKLSPAEAAMQDRAIRSFGDRSQNHWRYKDVDSYKQEIGLR